MADSERKEPRIDIVTAIILICLAGAFDLVQTGALALMGLVAVQTLGLGVAPGIALNTFINGIGTLFFGLIFMYLGVFDLKKAIFGGGVAFAEFFPIINILPAWTAYLVGMIIVSRIEDGNSPLAKAALTGAKAAKGEIDFKEEPRNKRNKRRVQNAERLRRLREARTRDEEMRQEQETAPEA